MNQLLESARTRLRPIVDEDMADLAVWLSDIEVQRFANPGIVAPMIAEDLLDEDGWMAADRNNPDSTIFAVIDKSTQALMGIVALSGINWHSRYGEFGINLANRDYQGKGYGKEVSETVLRYGFQQLNLHRIWLSVFSYNPRAIRLYEKMGFVREVTAREMLYRDGQYYDIITMGLLRDEWETRQ